MGDTVSSQRGGVGIGGSQTNIGGDVVGHDKIVHEAPRPLAMNLHQLPAPPRDFTGRAADLDAILNDIEHGALISGVRGMGGIGKTALALVIAERLKAQYPDVQFFVSLRGASDTPVTPLDAMQSVIRAYHPTAKLPDDATQIAALYRSVLDGQRAIVLLDDAKDTAQITPLLPPASCILLITTRQHFHVPGLRARNLETLPLDDARALLIAIAPRLDSVIPHSREAVQKLTRECHSEQREESLTLPATQPAAPEIPRAARNDTIRDRNDTIGVNDTIGAADEIARLCGCLPLALRAAASLITATPDLNPLTYAAQLRDERTRLTKIGKEGVEIDVEASLNLSYQQLSPAAARVFRQLSVFPASFDAQAAEVVCDDTDHAHLSQLVRLSLVQFNESTARYQLHDLARLFADALLADDERAPAHLRHAGHYERVLQTANELLLEGGNSLARGLSLFDIEQANVRAGQDWSSKHGRDSQAIAQLCSDYAGKGSLLNLRLHPREQIQWTQAGLEGTRLAHNRSDEGIHLGNLGLAYYSLGETRKAIEFYEQALIVMREIGDRRGEGNALGNLGIAYAALGETRKAIEYHEQALVIAREIGDRRGEANDLMNTGNAHDSLGEYQQAIKYHEQALPIFREIGDRRGEGNALGNLGNAYKNLGETRRAIEFYEQALVIMREIGDRRGEGNALWNMALALDKLGEHAQAIAHAEAALKIYEAIEDPHAEKVRRQLAQWKT